MFRYLLTLLYLLHFFVANSQCSISFDYSLSDDTHLNSKKPQITIKQQIKVDNLKFYISHVSFLNSNDLVEVDSSYRLVDFSDSSSTLFSVNHDSPFDKITFQLGVDSISNVSGAMEGTLNPTEGMYWTWQSGYINFKLEGTKQQQNKTQEFKYHLGGYLSPYETVQTVELAVVSTDQIRIVFDAHKFLTFANSHAKPNVMSPGKQAQMLSQYLKECFSVDE